MKQQNSMDLDYRVSAYLAYHHAMDFVTGARVLYDEGVSRPVMVNIVFACELYLKALIIWKSQSQSIIREHKLKELFNMLDQSIQYEIKQEVSIEDWDTFLDDSSDAFRAWRYYYEKNNIMFGHIGGLFSLAETLDRICARTMPLKEVVPDEQ